MEEADDTRNILEAEHVSEENGGAEFSLESIANGAEQKLDREAIKGTSVQDLPDVKIKRNYNCSWCGYFTQNPREYLYHIKNVHGQRFRIYECPECVYASRHSQKLQRHYKMIHDKKGGSHKTDKNLKSRGPKMSPRISYSAPVSPRTFLTPTSPKGQSDPEVFPFEKPEHVKKLDHEFQMVSEETLMYEDCLTSGDKSVKNFDITKCSLCSFKTKSSLLMKRHEAVAHLKKKFYRCKKCNYVTWVKARFTKHMKYHNMPMVKCDLCDFRTPYKWNLDRHMKNHVGGGLYKCQKCNFTAHIRQSLTFHIQHHHLKRGESVTRRIRKKPTLNEMPFYDFENVEELDESDYVSGSLSNDFSGSKDNYNKENFLSLKKEKAKKSISTFESVGGDSNSNLGSGNVKNGNKKQPKIKIILKKSKIKQQKERHRFGSDFVHPDDIVQKNGQMFIKDIKCDKCNFKTAFEVDLLKHYKKVHEHEKKNSDAPRIKMENAREDASPMILKVPSFLKAPHESFDDEKSDYTNGILSLSSENVELKGDDNSDQRSLVKTEIDTSSYSESIDSAIKSKKIRSCSFFDNFKQKIAQVDANNLICSECNYKAKCLSEALHHQKIHITSQKNSGSSVRGTRCQFCRRRCKTEMDLSHHEKVCEAAVAYKKEQNQDDLITKITGSIADNIIITNEASNSDPGRQEPHPMENKVFVWNRFCNSSEEESLNHGSEMDWENCKEEPSSRPASRSSFYNESIGTPDSSSMNEDNEGEIMYTNDGTETVKMKKVYKCPDCSFWATTASRFHVHIVGHLNMKPFKCSACSYKSNWRWDITKHIRLKANRDEIHCDAVVMMTDNSGERNYEKYEKYITLMSIEGRGPNFRNADIIPKRKTTRTMTRYGSKNSKLLNTNETKKLGRYSRKFDHLNLEKAKFEDSSKNSKLFMGSSGTSSLIKNTGILHSNSPQMQPYQIMSSQNNSRRFSLSTKLTSTHVSNTQKLNYSSNSRTMNSQYLGQFSQDMSHLSSLSDYQIKPEVSIYPAGSVSNSLSEKFQLTDQMKNKHHSLKRSCDFDERPEPEKTKVFVTDQGIPKKTTVWKCKKCNYRSSNKETILKHIREHYTDKNVKLALPLFKCGYCEQVSNWKHVIQRHCRLKHNGNISVIENSSKTPVHNSNEESESNAKESKDISAEFIFKDMSFQCKICPYICKKRQEMKVHLQTHIQRPDAIFKCMFCPYYVSVKRALNQHMKLHGVKEPQQFLTQVLERNARAAGEVKNGNRTSSAVGSSEENSELGKRYHCINCPYVTNSRSQFLYHKQFHRPLRAAQYKCNFCTYNVSRRHLLNQHLKVHQQKEHEDQPAHPESDLPIGSRLQSALQGEPQTRGDVPLVWVSRGNRFYKMFKCHYCPHVNLRKSNIHEHEKMHGRKLNSHMHTCTLCNYSCSNPGVIAVHMRVHRHKLGKLHGLVDSRRSDAEQVREISHTAVLGSPSDFAKNKSESMYLPSVEENNQMGKPLMYFCQYCPARFLKSTEIEIHKKFHIVKLQYKCETCSYTARQEAHLLAHMKVHSEEYLQKTINLLQDHHVSDEYPVPDVVLADLPSDCQVSYYRAEAYEDLEESSSFKADSDVSSACGRDRVLSCPKCPSKFMKSANLNYHLGLHGSKGRYTCDRRDCDYAIDTMDNLIRHQAIHEEWESRCKAESSESMEVMPNDIEIEIDSYTDAGRKRFRKYEDIPMSGVDLLKRKLEYQHKQNRYSEVKDGISEGIRGYNRNNDPARIGNPAFVYPTVIKNGKVKEKRYKCPKCPTALEKRDQYKIHLTLHGARNRYTCEKCSYSVKYYANYLQHIEKHQRFEEVLRQQGTPVHDPTVARPADSCMFSDNDQPENVNVKVMCSHNQTHMLNHTVSTTHPLTLVERQQLILQELKQKSVSLREESKKVYFCSYCPFNSLKRDHQKSHSFRHRHNGVLSQYNCSHCDYSAPQLHFLREHVKCHFRPPKNALKPEAFLMLDAIDIISHLEGVRHDDDTKENHHCHSLFHYEKTDNNLTNDDHVENLEVVDLNSGELLKEDKSLDVNPGCELDIHTKEEDCDAENL